MTMLSTILARARGSQFLRHNAIFFSGSLVVSVLNYLYYPILGRLLPATSFGEIQAVVSLFLQATIFLGVVGNVAVNVVANEPDPVRRSRTVGELERLAGLVVLIALVAGLLALPAIQRYLHFADPLPFIILGISLFVSVPLSLRQAYLRGVNAFGRLSMSNILSAGAKLLASVAFVLGGFGTAGAIGGLVAAQLIALIYTARYARRLGLHPLAGRWRWPDLAVIRPQLAYAGLVLIISLVTTVQFSFDILVVKHYFSAEVAGAYAGIATIARIIYFLTGSVAGVLLSTVKLGEPAAATRGLLWRSVVLQGVLGGAALTAFALFPAFFTRLLLGPRYLELSSLLPELSLALFIIAFINLLLTYDLALRRYSSAVIAVTGAALTFGAVALHHGTPAAVVRALLIGSALMLGLRLLDTARRRLWQAGPRPIRF